MSIQNNLKDQLQWLEKEGSMDRYKGFTKYEIPAENRELVGSSANLNNKRFAQIFM